MTAVSGINHVAVVTAGLDRFVRFYTTMFGADVVFSETTPAFRHAILRLGRESWLHPVHVEGNPHGLSDSPMLDRGHLDHIGLTASSTDAFHATRNALVAAGAIEDLGAFHSLWFRDPDGMRGELVLIVDPHLQGIHEPRKLPAG